jgi:hypothetical protein
METQTKAPASEPSVKATIEQRTDRETLFAIEDEYKAALYQHRLVNFVKAAAWRYRVEPDQAVARTVEMEQSHEVARCLGAVVYHTSDPTAVFHVALAMKDSCTRDNISEFATVITEVARATASGSAVIKTADMIAGSDPVFRSHMISDLHVLLSCFDMEYSRSMLVSRTMDGINKLGAANAGTVLKFACSVSYGKNLDASLVALDLLSRYADADNVERRARRILKIAEVGSTGALYRLKEALQEPDNEGRVDRAMRYAWLKEYLRKV